VVTGWIAVPGVDESLVVRAERVMAAVCAKAGFDAEVSSAPYDDPEEDDRVLLITGRVTGEPRAMAKLQRQVSEAMAREDLLFPRTPIVAAIVRG